MFGGSGPKYWSLVYLNYKTQYQRYQSVTSMFLSEMQKEVLHVKAVDIFKVETKGIWTLSGCQTLWNMCIVNVMTV